jgi:hypothetical protein
MALNLMIVFMVPGGVAMETAGGAGTQKAHDYMCHTA